jgi:hypothetical protein
MENVGIVSNILRILFLISHMREERRVPKHFNATTRSGELEFQQKRNDLYTGRAEFADDIGELIQSPCTVGKTATAYSSGENLF